MSNFNMSFRDFAESVRPTGAINRYPSIGGQSVFSYSVYMNGLVAQTLPEHAREHLIEDLPLHALTQELQLDKTSARDNLKVAELVGLRGAWMSAVMESSVALAGGLSDQVVEDYGLLVAGLKHPWIIEQLDTQRMLAAKLQPALERAGAAVGAAVRDLPPKEVSVGTVVAQDNDFTIQQTAEGEVVTHENRRLSMVPTMGSEVTVSYYRGSGQVVQSLANLKVSPPFIDPVSGDLSVILEDGKGVEQMILFNSVSGFEKFVQAHGMSGDLVRQAIDVREASPKLVEPAAKREISSAAHIDPKSGCLAIDYKEKGATFTALFRSASEMASVAKDFGLGAQAVAAAEALEVNLRARTFRDETACLNAVLDDLVGQGYDANSIHPTSVEGKTYIGKVVAVGALHVAQDLGRKTVAIHDLRNLDKVANVGDNLTVKFEGGRGIVTDMVRASKDVGR